ncbi:MAG: hypothetical protein JW839_19845 [Candidatus Lokiarchaeota archaeon]|nr:hypothetical protein [Candidatus Lokiarchaeota archaeon]
MIETTPSTRARNKKNVSIWIDKNLLESWDDHCEKKGTSRTQLIIDAVNDRLANEENLRDLSMRIDRLAEIVADFNPDAESLIAESRRANTRGRVLEQILITREKGIRREDIKGFSSYALQVALESLEKDDIIRGDKVGRYWLADYFPES